jgi:transglutaminase-like putative cysteine protease
MTTLASDAKRDLPLALVAAGTTWFTMLSWRGFTDLWGQYLGPLLLISLVVAFGGVVLRAAPMPRRFGFALHVLVVAVVVWLTLGGSLIHPVSSTQHISDSISNAWFSASTFAPPIPETVPSIAPLMIPCGALALLVVDLFACWLRRVSLAGLPLLAVYCVPISLLGDGVSWVIFLGAAAGFLLMLFFQESAHIARWGRPLGGSAAAADPNGFGVSTGASRTNASTVGVMAVVLAVILPVFIPTLHLDGLGLFGPGGGSTVKVINPITDMRRNLDRGKNVPLLEIHTTDPDPSYLRISVLTQFNGVEWTTGDRAIVPDQTASGLLPILEQYLGASVVTKPYQYQVTATKYFDSTWLPTEFPVSSIVAPGDWHYDMTTMDFLAANANTNTQGISYRMTAAKPVLSAYSMVNSLTAPQQIQQTYTQLPSQVSPLAAQLARRVTRGATSRFQEMEMLQRWFRSTGGFRYSLKTAPGDGNSALDRFLSPGKGGRVGYCEQFASAFAVMARTLEIPARVAVGFLQPERVGPDEWRYRAHDLHAWPEVFFRGSGWVRFEPTPASRTGNPPTYTTGAITKPRGGKAGQTQGGKVTDPTSSASPSGPHNQTKSSPSSSSSPSSHIPWTVLLLSLGVVVLVGVLLMVPGTVRRSRRARRLAGGAEAAWAELRDSAIDLGVSWPNGRSPHETSERLAGWFGPEPDGAPAVRPPRGHGLAPAAESALDRIVLMVEQVRYARSADDVAGALADDVRTCVAALEHGSTGSALRRARWLPRSVFSSRRGTDLTALQREPEAVSPGGVVDHVG